VGGWEETSGAECSVQTCLRGGKQMERLGKAKRAGRADRPVYFARARSPFHVQMDWVTTDGGTGETVGWTWGRELHHPGLSGLPVR
jgi:hypothetical protein